VTLKISLFLRTKFLYFLIVLLCFSSCVDNKSVLSRTKYTAKNSSPTGKYRNPTMLMRVNPFQGAAKAKLNQSKRKKFKLYKRKHKQRGSYRKGEKPGKSFGMKRTISRRRLKSSGSRTKLGGGKKRNNKNLFKTRKK